MKTYFYNLDMGTGSCTCRDDDGKCSVAAMPDNQTPRAATIGFFDGVHRGHQFLIRQLREAAADRGMQTMAITFDRHPREVVRAASDTCTLRHLTTLDEKCALLASTGIDTLVVLHFDRQMAALSAEQFMERVLARDLGVRLLLTGYDNRFGHDRTEGFDDYCRYGERMGMDVVAGQPLYVPDDNATGDGRTAVSSSVIRRLITGGRVEQAATLLGYHYTVGGLVVHGEQRGRQMGFPTANLQPYSTQKLIPKAGVYAVVARTEDGRLMPGMTNIGMRPTFHGDAQTIETHLMTGNTDTAAIDLYDQKLELQFVAWLRDERTFDSPEALARQLQEDKRMALKHRLT